MSEFKYCAFDPGDSTGWATFSENGDPVGMGTLTSYEGKEVFYDFLRGLPRGIDIICENYFLLPYKALAQSWSPLDTVRYIGAIDFYCYLSGSRVHYQSPSVKAIAYRWAGVKQAKNHAVSHQLDAYVHGVYYLQKAGIRRPQQGRAPV